VRHSVRVNGLDGLALNKLDTLCGLGDLKVCVAYKKQDGTILKNFPAALEELDGVEPVYETLPGFTEDISGCRSFDELPETCKAYIRRVEELIECPVCMIGVGPDRTQTIEKN
ncbi:MAG: adenylosuccinate synthetase, partial [Oscillospiraceae bacterium]|nr:adenylosuccinate synthetase [Oscillospiraceae bacterium]